MVAARAEGEPQVGEEGGDAIEDVRARLAVREAVEEPTEALALGADATALLASRP